MLALPHLNSRELTRELTHEWVMSELNCSRPRNISSWSDLRQFRSGSGQEDFNHYQNWMSLECEFKKNQRQYPLIESTKSGSIWFNPYKTDQLVRLAYWLVCPDRPIGLPFHSYRQSVCLIFFHFLVFRWSISSNLKKYQR